MDVAFSAFPGPRKLLFVLRVILVVIEEVCARVWLDDGPSQAGIPVFSAIPILIFATTSGLHPVVRVDTSALNAAGLPDQDVRQLREALLARLVEEGYLVANGADDAELGLKVQPADTGWSIEATGSGVRVYHIESGPLAVVALEILQRATMALDSVANGRHTVNDMAQPAEATGVVEHRDNPTASHAQEGSTKREPITVSVGADAGILARAGGVDPIVGAKMDAGFSRLGGRFRAGIDWSNGTAPLSIFEVHLQMGPTWSAPIGSSTRFTAGLLGGALVHHFHFDPQDDGARIDWDFAAPAELTTRWNWATFGLGLSAGVSGPPRDHEISGVLAWHRGPFYLGVTAGCGVLL